jgi:2-polyprenyl-3-methyl-5-hydroxy-6-metoxy-1,4-benzoquinol methylase
MSEYRLFTGEIPYVSTAEFHADRERAPHLEQAFHQERLYLAAEFVKQAARESGGATVSDLGCGDGGLLSLVQDAPGVRDAWGYDFCPANEAGWVERGVQAEQLDVFGGDWNEVGTGSIIVMTEVLEHLADPHGILRRVIQRDGAKGLVCSSPWNERPGMHSPEHAWAWDFEGYASMITTAGWTIVRHEQAGLFQVVLAR